MCVTLPIAQDHSLFAGFYRRRRPWPTLTADWTEAGAALVSGSAERLQIGGYDGVGCGVQAGSALIRVCFELLADVPSRSEISVDEATMVDDLEGSLGIGCRMPSITPVEDSTWGHIKALFH